ncbi:hypothetical protein BOTBODRAFT_60673 [Botryobasidium botryosum FD-172 SS1]|uniref:VWFA domain-containing protein n=1 Tax=Botryobasidium botryosum (strain FD-172 SS1) TaxID=930990 RepID=A0A067M421_BOTB1|nr:hypothetical protein BOTBODRAFT_60673 [Botryobasidium botryosum FD-172 SS1]
MVTITSTGAPLARRATAQENDQNTHFAQTAPEDDTATAAVPDDTIQTDEPTHDQASFKSFSDDDMESVADETAFEMVDAADTGGPAGPETALPTDETNMATASATDENPDFDETIEEPYTSSHGPEPSGLSADAEVDRDLLDRTSGVYRLLELYSEQGSGGLVDKIIISQDSISALINYISPGAYASMTKVDFAALDQLAIKPLGVYGNKSEIVKLLEETGAVDHEIANLLLTPVNSSELNQSILRPGLYAVLASPSSSESGEEHVQPAYIIFWPEETTWADDAISSVRRNRITFMRYLSKITDQLLALLSPTDARSMVWNDELDELDTEEEDAEDLDRLYTFEVSKTKDQQEDVKISAGFTIEHRDIRPPSAADGLPADYLRPQLQPRLVAGETRSGFITTVFKPEYTASREYTANLNELRLKDMLEDLHRGISLSKTLKSEEVKILVENGLKTRCPQPVAAWEKRNQDYRTESRQHLDGLESKIRATHSQPDDALSPYLKQITVQEVMKIYPVNEVLLLDQEETLPTVEASRDRLAQLAQLHPKVDRKIADCYRQVKFEKIADPEYRELKKRFLVVRELIESYGAELRPQDRAELVQLILSREELLPALTGFSRAQTNQPGFVGAITRHFSNPQPFSRQRVLSALWDAERYPDSSFITTLVDIQHTEPMFAGVIAQLYQLFYVDIKTKITSALSKLQHAIATIQQDDEIHQWTQEARVDLEKLLHGSLQTLVTDIKAMLSGPQSRHFSHIKRVARSSWGWGRESYNLDILEKRDMPAQIEYTINIFNLTQHDTQQLSTNHRHVPQPTVRPSLSAKFSLVATRSIRHVQLLDKGKCLLLVDDSRAGVTKIYLEDLASADNALAREDTGTRLNHERVGKDFLFSVDESKGLLAIFFIAQSNYHLQIYAFDEKLTRVHARGSPIDLSAWYREKPRISCICFVSGSEEILLLEASGIARIYSMVTMQFRPARLILKNIPESLFSTPDGSCLIVIERQASDLILRAYHWASFGSPNLKEIVFLLGVPGTNSCSITSYVQRSCVHFLCLLPDTHACSSFALDITKKVSEFSFRAHGNERSGARDSTQITRNNCLIDCHADVWSRFPVVAAIRRNTLKSAGRCPPSITFATDRDQRRYSGYFDGLVRTFERTKRKPTNHLLDDIQICASPLATLKSAGLHSDVSVFKFGEWFVELFCLIPIHIAIANSNRFIPLKDGVYSPEYELSLLGADVSKIVESLSLGWYESIFRSYMATTPVKVVTSMGEQSVGKSYALNHLVDTSFAGSAMRCTEGVWLSLTPTRDALVVAIDFEGVHSIERSAQEDTLLVLFNAAISNLVLFRNNFVLSRDIAGLFASFQSSSSVLDPAENPTLFQSTLAIIIKDVVDSDKEEIVKEFQLKFQKIVHDEQEQNFITRMHSGRLDIIPWPVIESARFYSSFAVLRRRLERQPSTHGPAGVFLHTLKTLMAKIKVCDWGSLDQNLASHRAQQLLATLPTAFSHGFTAVEPDSEPLKDMDTDKAIPSTDSDAIFYVRHPDLPPEEDLQLKAQSLLELRNSWSSGFSIRHTMVDTEWIKHLTSFLQDLAQRRIQHVRDWVTANVFRFPEDNSDIRNLQRAFQNGMMELQASIELCGSVCGSCNLLCVQEKRHGSSHDCSTSHRCVQECDFDHDDEGVYNCGLPAGHAGRHSCDTTSHSCGQLCDLYSAGGCMQTCSLPADHLEDEHLCSARSHTCNKPCDLNNPQMSLSCEGRCVVEWGEPHTQHICENKLSCPAQCKLCMRLCAHRDHLHGLLLGSIHLCGQEHPCPEVCELPGTCYISTTPQKIETTFSGRHERFQYTKSTQIAKRLPCVVPILADETAHTGQHIHSTEEEIFHYCEERCPSCSYFCLLPLDHTQIEHETSHGSMSQTTWSIEGPEDAVFELDNHKYATGDSGAPMLCSLFCRDMGRHAHISHCRGSCPGPEIQHINAPIGLDPDQPKDWISHRLFWARSDPYSATQQTEFSKCDAQCPGPEHDTANDANARPEFCTLPIFHPEEPQGTIAGGYISTDGHKFSCSNPALVRQSYHVIFVIDKSGSMIWGVDHLPLPGTPNGNLISLNNNNRFGAVLSALESFWISRVAATASAGQAARNDAYSIVLFDDNAHVQVANDFTSTPDQLIHRLLTQGNGGGTDFGIALQVAQSTMESHWSNERSPVLIFLSDGECGLDESRVYDICRRAVSLGKSLSLHAISFGEDYYAASLRNMARIATEVQTAAPLDQQGPPCGYNSVLGTIQLAETFLGIAESMRKPRAALVRH